MNSLKTLLLIKSIAAAAVAAGGVAAPAVVHAIDLFGPAAGVVCRSGYTPAFNGSALICSKSGSFELPLVCSNPTFDNYVIRIGRSGSEEDICVRDGVVITSSQSLTNVPLSTNGNNGSYVFATFDPAALAAKLATQDQNEASALGLAAGDVATRAGTTVVKANGRTGGTGEAQVPVTFHTFAIPKSVFTGGTAPIGSSATPATFVPRALPR